MAASAMTRRAPPSTTPAAAMSSCTAALATCSTGPRSRPIWRLVPCYWGAAAKGIDATPMEGIDRQALDEELG